MRGRSARDERAKRVAEVAALVAATLTAVAAWHTGAATAGTACPNEAVRTGWSSRLPDCRAYEMVTPANKGTAQDLFAGSGTAADNAGVSPSGERVTLETSAKMGDATGPGVVSYVFTRKAGVGWQMATVHPAVGSEETLYEANVFNAALSEVGVDTSTHSNFVSGSPDQTFYVGPVGGPYSEVATTPYVPEYISGHRPDQLTGASDKFHIAVLATLDHELLRPASATVEGADDLYEWSKTTGALRRINVSTSGTQLSTCGAELGFGTNVQGQFAAHAVSEDGDKIFFTVPDSEVGFSTLERNASCEAPTQLYMRVNGAETVEVSAPEPGMSDPTGVHPVQYAGAAADGSKVFFTTTTELTKDDLGYHSDELYMYDTETRKLTRISAGETGAAEGEVRAAAQEASGISVAEDGSAVYFLAKGRLTANAPTPPSEGYDLYRYDTVTGSTRYITTYSTGPSTDQEHVTPDGEYFVFQDGANLGGFDADGHHEIYLYSNPSNSIVCVSCSGKSTPAVSEAGFPQKLEYLETLNSEPALTVLSADGGYVFFETTAHLVQEDSNAIGVEGERGTKAVGNDVYEWERDGNGNCKSTDGCLHLISPGTEDVAGALLLGASEDGSNVFFSSHTKLVAQDTDDMGDIYDARIDGGFPAPTSAVECGESCQSPLAGQPLFGTPASVAFSGLGNLQTSTSSPHGKPHRRHGAAQRRLRRRRLKRALRRCGPLKQRQERRHCERRARARWGLRGARRRAAKQGRRG